MLAGVIEPPSAKPVVIEDDVVIGANAVVLEGVTVGKGAVVAAGAIVVEDVEPYTVVAGTPAKKSKTSMKKLKAKQKSNRNCASFRSGSEKCVDVTIHAFSHRRGG